jgi:glutamate synthase domain-containing protein 1
MATESAITTQGSHPYSTSEDECLVHNGSLSNHNNVRRSLIKDGKILILKTILKLQLDIFQIKYQKVKV